MKSLTEFLRSFLQNKGQHVFLSLLVAKLCGFAGSLFIIKILAESEFGTMSIVASIFAIFAPFSGFGSHQALLRYGSVTDGMPEKQALSEYLMKKGFYYQLLLSLLFLFVSLYYIGKYEDVFVIFIFFAIRLVGFYFLNQIQSELRVAGNNRAFAQMSNVVNIAGVVLLLLLSWLFGIKGYLIAITVAPFLAVFWYKRQNFEKHTDFFYFNKKELWDYGLQASGTALLSDALFSVDVLLLGFLMNENAVAVYKVAILIPSNITFLALAFMQSDFPVLAKSYRNRHFLTGYMANYYKIFVPVAFLIFFTGFFLKTEMLQGLFSAKYGQASQPFIILLGAFCINLLLRNLYGNLLSAVGRMKTNTLISLVTILLQIGLSFVLVPKFGVTGMGITMAATMLVNGLLLMSSFLKYLKNLN